MEQQLRVKVDDSFEYYLKDSDVLQLDLLKLSKTNFHLIENKKNYKIEVEKSDFLNKTYTIRVNSKSYKVTVKNELDKLIKEMGFSVGNTKKPNDIKAPMPGIILSINVEKGQEVKEGDTLLILEAMKMENAIGSPKDGIVKQVNVKSGGTVEKGMLMIELE